jgi:hypothetical protein
MFKPAENMQAFLKLGIYGTAGSGKTFTAGQIGLGVARELKPVKPVYFLDTETGSDFLIPAFKEAGVPLFAHKSRAFIDLVDAIAEAEKHASVLIIDSISHFWEEIQSAYKKKTGRQRISMQEWGIIKEQWRVFTDLFINSKLHIVICGRSRDVSDWEEQEDGKKELVKTGTTMKTEKDMAYEPSFLVEMVKEYARDGKVHGKLWDHTAYILKDRTGLLEGKKFVNPTFEDFRPIFNFLNIGGKHLGIETDRSSVEIFEDGNDRNWAFEKKQREILLEEIEGEITAYLPGRSKEETSVKAELIFNTFGTRSWAKVGELSSAQLKDGLNEIIKKINTMKTVTTPKTKKETENAAS